MAKSARPTLEKVKRGDVGARYYVSGASVSDVQDFVDQFFEDEGYRLEKGDLGDGRYGKGNPILRLILGAFYPRYAFNVVVDEDSQQRVTITVERAESGYAGGLIGRNQVIKEEKRIVEALEEELQGSRR